MTTKPANGLSIASIEKAVATETPADLEPVLPNGDPSGIILLVKSDQAPSVIEALNKLANTRRKKEQIAQAQAQKARPGEAFIPVEQDMLAYRKAVAIRLAGWRGLTDEFTEDNAIHLLSVLPTFGPQILEKASEMTGFTPTSSTT